MSGDANSTDESLFPIAVLIDELRHEDVQVRTHNPQSTRTLEHNSFALIAVD